MTPLSLLLCSESTDCRAGWGRRPPHPSFEIRAERTACASATSASDRSGWPLIRTASQSDEGWPTRPLEMHSLTGDSVVFPALRLDAVQEPHEQIGHKDSLGSLSRLLVGHLSVARGVLDDIRFSDAYAAAAEGAAKGLGLLQRRAMRAVSSGGP